MTDTIDFIVEIPVNTNVKYEIDKKTNFLRVDRILHTHMTYPGNYGYAPNTLADDGDPIDILMILDIPIQPMTIVAAKIIGVLLLEDEAGKDDKLIVVPCKTVDKTYEHINDIGDISSHQLDKVAHFFKHYKDLEPGKWVKNLQFENKNHALKIYQQSRQAYYDSIL